MSREPAQLDPVRIPLDATPMDVMMLHVGVREIAPNRGPWIDETLRFVGLEPAAPDAPRGGYPWCCSSFVWCAHKGGVQVPRTASVARMWSMMQDRRIEEPVPGCAFVHLEPGGAHGHIGFVLRRGAGGDVLTLSGNTNGSGSRNGDRVGIVMHSMAYVRSNGGGFFHMRPAPKVA